MAQVNFITELVSVSAESEIKWTIKNLSSFQRDLMLTSDEAVVGEHNSKWFMTARKERYSYKTQKIGLKFYVRDDGSDKNRIYGFNMTLNGSQRYHTATTANYTGEPSVLEVAFHQYLEIPSSVESLEIEATCCYETVVDGNKAKEKADQALCGKCQGGGDDAKSVLKEAEDKASCDTVDDVKVFDENGGSMSQNLDGESNDGSFEEIEESDCCTCSDIDEDLKDAQEKSPGEMMDDEKVTEEAAGQSLASNFQKEIKPVDEASKKKEENASKSTNDAEEKDEEKVDSALIRGDQKSLEITESKPLEEVAEDIFETRPNKFCQDEKNTNFDQPGPSGISSKPLKSDALSQPDIERGFNLAPEAPGSSRTIGSDRKMETYQATPTFNQQLESDNFSDTDDEFENQLVADFQSVTLLITKRIKKIYMHKMRQVAETSARWFVEASRTRNMQLMSECSKSLAAQLTLDNFPEIWKIAHELKCEEMKKYVTKFFIRNYDKVNPNACVPLKLELQYMLAKSMNAEDFHAYMNSA